MNGEVLIVDEHTGRILPAPLQRGHAPGHRGQGGGGDQAGEPDPGHDHPAELLPPLRQALRHDRYGDDRGRRVQPDLQPRRRADPDQQADGPRRPGRPDLQAPRTPSSTPSSTTSSSGTSKGQPVLVGTVERGEVRAPVRSCCASAASRTRCSTPSTTSGRPRSSPRPAARARSPSPPTWPAAAPTSCWAATPSSWRRPSCASAACRRWRPPRSTRRPGPRRLEKAQAGGRGRARRGGRPRRAVRAGHRAARVAPDRQPAARPLRPAGRPGRVPVLPVPRGRPDAAVQRRAWSSASCTAAQHPRGRADRGQDGHQRHPVGADPGRGAELRDPQERPEVRRGAQPAAHRDLRRAPPGARGRGPARADPAHDRRRRRRLRAGRHQRGLPRGVGPRAAVDGAAAPCTRSR